MNRYLFFFLLMVAPVTDARIGKTVSECVARYGNPTDQYSGEIWFYKENLHVGCHFREQVCDYIFYFSIGRLTDHQISLLLEANLPKGTRWIKDKRSFSTFPKWVTADGTRFTRWHRSSFFIYTVDAWNRLEAKRKAEDRKTLKGF